MRLASYSGLLQQARPDLVLANVAYLPLAAAHDAKIPAAALCSLNWADIYVHYCGKRPEAAAILAEMRTAYASGRISCGCNQPCRCGICAIALAADLHALLAQSSRPPLSSNGVQQVVKIVATMLADKQNSAA